MYNLRIRITKNDLIELNSIYCKNIIEDESHIIWCGEKVINFKGLKLNLCRFVFLVYTGVLPYKVRLFKTCANEKCAKFEHLSTNSKVINNYLIANKQYNITALNKEELKGLVTVPYRNSELHKEDIITQRNVFYNCMKVLNKKNKTPCLVIKNKSYQKMLKKELGDLRKFAYYCITFGIKNNDKLITICGNKNCYNRQHIEVEKTWEHLQKELEKSPLKNLKKLLKQ